MSSPNPQPKKSISINLMDLNKKHARKESPTACIAPQISQSDVRIDNLLGNDNVYEKELLKLLEKAKGTPYENSVRKFLSSKLGTSHVTPSRDDTDASSYGTAEEDLMAKQRALSRQRTRIDVLAQPLLRQEPQVPVRMRNNIILQYNIIIWRLPTVKP